MRLVLVPALAMALSAPAFAEKWTPMPMVRKDILAAGISPGGEGCQYPQHIAIDPKEGSFLLYATDVGGIYRSIDGGKTFQSCNTGFSAVGACGFAIDPAHIDRALAVGDNTGNAYYRYDGIYLSTDRGATWKQVLPKLNRGNEKGREQIAFDPASYDAAKGYTTLAYWAEEGNGEESARLYRTVDGGQNWSLACLGDGYGGGDGSALLKVHPARGWVYIADNSGFWKSMDSGKTFTLKKGGLKWAFQSGSITGGHIHLDNWGGDAKATYKPGKFAAPYTFALDLNGAGTGSGNWARAYFDYVDGDDCHFLNLNGGSGNTVELKRRVKGDEKVVATSAVHQAASGRFEITVAADGAITVKAGTTTLFDGVKDTLLGPGTVGAGGTFNVVDADNFEVKAGGATVFAEDFQSGNQGSPFTSLDLAPGQPDKVWATTTDSLFVSADAGEHFTALKPQGLANILHLKVSPADPRSMVATNSGTGERFWSGDGGVTWAKSALDMAKSFIPADILYNDRNKQVAWHPKDAQAAFAIGPGDLMSKTSDGGKTFAWNNNGNNGIMLGGMFNFNQQNPDVLYFGSQDYNGAATRDGGKSWTFVNLSISGSDNDPWGWVYGGYAADSLTYFGGSHPYTDFNALSLWITFDGGKTSEKKVDQLAGAQASFGDPRDANVLFCFNQRSADKGKTWNALAGCDGVFAASPAGNRDLYGRNGKDVVKSTDHGASWTKVTSMDKDVQDVAYDATHDRLWVVAGNALYRCDGPAYTPQNSNSKLPADQHGDGPAVTTVAVDPIQPDIVYAGGDGNGLFFQRDNAVARSTDGGQTWEKLTCNPKYGPASGGQMAHCLRVHPKTRELWSGSDCYGFWRIGAPGSPDPTAVAPAPAPAALRVALAGRALRVLGIAPDAEVTVRLYDLAGNLRDRLEGPGSRAMAAGLPLQTLPDGVWLGRLDLRDARGPRSLAFRLGPGSNE